MELSDSIAFAGLLATIITGFGVPFLERPMLGYDTTSIDKKPGVQDIETYNVIIHNIGIVTLNKVIGSINIDVLNFTSKPFLADNFNTATNYTHNGLFRIDALSPQSDVRVLVEMNTSGVDPEYPVGTFISADEWKGYPTWYIHSINIITLMVAVVLSIFLINLWRKY